MLSRKPLVACCDPWLRLWPSGTSWTHSRKCPIRPNQKITSERAALVALNRLHRAETARTGLGPTVRPVAWLRPDEPHPQCAAAFADKGMDAILCSRCAPILHAATCPCAPCESWWTHVDDAVDERA